MELILVRHGESLHNINASTSWDSKLSTNGREQAILAAAELKDEKIDEFWCSPMHRALETANIIADNRNTPIKALINLSEHGYGWEEVGLSRSCIIADFPRIELPIEVDVDGWARHYKQESKVELYNRTKVISEQIIQVASKRKIKTLLVVTHGKSGTELLKQLLHIPEESRLYFHMANCGITRLFLDTENNTTNVICVNYIQHLNHSVKVNHLSRRIPKYQ
ncbi:histidine phosphatase family protein [Radiobacillus sp. PE A8.2]|uniref:histidine phosphatase family protein n=1 Tax=Radiobacillus sp. PE A8.2 TaxID=3380349 RepID=UPI003890DDEB